MVKKVISSLDLSKVSGPDCIAVVFLNNCEPEVSYVLAELFNRCLKVSCSPGGSYLRKNFMAPIYGWDLTASRLEPLRVGSFYH